MVKAVAVVVFMTVFAGCRADQATQHGGGNAETPAPVSVAQPEAKRAQVEGEAPPAEPSESPPEWLPLYPGTEGLYSSGGRTMVNFLNKDDPTDIISFYAERLEEAGFTFDHDPLARENMGRLQAHRGEGEDLLRVEVVVIRGSPSSSTQVVVAW